MTSFRTEVNISKADQLMRYDSSLLFMGSCFASNIGQYFLDTSFNCQVNPFGVLYNPSSIANSLIRMLEQRTFNDNEVHEHNDSFHSFYHHSSFNTGSISSFLSKANKALSESGEFLKKADFLFITFGTSWIYEHKQNQQVVSNCHKYPASTFERRLLSSDEIVENYHQVIDRICKVNPEIQIIFTVSPVRHWKDGAHNNQISKATLLLAIEKLNAMYPCTSYFPAYELIMDDLRDYRYYKDDMLHPSEIAIKYIRDKFTEAFFSEDTSTFNQKMQAIIKSSNHRPFNLSSDAHQIFVRKYVSKVINMQKEYNNIDLSRLKAKFEDQMI